ncbi:hypothetical protein ACFO4O_04250 [Glaciecola siphonariae]|uniref:Phage antitermination protein Q n=1 Tax=Glaciecola siphonariae TaxID=521012 RepID=A0ABV9LT47_9ALTE
MNLSNYDVVELLKEWGAWSSTGIGKGSLETPLYDNSHWISDDIGLAIDSAVGKLRLADESKKRLDASRKIKRHSPRYAAITFYYKRRYNIPMVANALKCGDDKAALILKSGEAFIESALGLHEVA